MEVFDVETIADRKRNQIRGGGSCKWRPRGVDTRQGRGEGYSGQAGGGKIKMNELFLLLLMIFCHIVDDYYLQGWLASAKQRKWWEQNAPDKLYRFDYIVALAMHSISWSFMIMLPIAFNSGFDIGVRFIGIFCANALIHGLTDNAKANLKLINLIQDQFVHLLQIVGTFIFLVLL